MTRNSRFDMMRILMSLLVVLVHVSAAGCYASPLSITPLLYNVMGRVAVPIFFMVSGAIALEKAETPGRTWKRMLRRILLPLLAWSVIFAVYRGVALGENAWRILLNLSTAPAYYHLLFMYQMAGLYLLLPILQPGWRCLSLKAQFPLAFALLLIGFAVSKGLLFPMQPAAWYIGYALLGSCCEKLIRSRQRGAVAARLEALACVAVCVVCVVATWWIVHWQSAQVNALNETYLSYDSLPIMVCAACLYAAFLLWPGTGRRERAERILAKCNRYTLGIYLLHPMLLSLLIGRTLTLWGKTVCLSWDMIHPAVAIPLITGFIYVLSMLAVALWTRLTDVVCCGRARPVQGGRISE